MRNGEIREKTKIYRFVQGNTNKQSKLEGFLFTSKVVKKKEQTIIECRYSQAPSARRYLLLRRWCTQSSPSPEMSEQDRSADPGEVGCNSDHSHIMKGNLAGHLTHLAPTRCHRKPWHRVLLQRRCRLKVVRTLHLLLSPLPMFAGHPQRCVRYGDYSLSIILLDEQSVPATIRNDSASLYSYM